MKQLTEFAWTAGSCRLFQPFRTFTEKQKQANFALKPQAIHIPHPTRSHFSGGDNNANTATFRKLITCQKPTTGVFRLLERDLAKLILCFMFRPSSIKSSTVLCYNINKLIQAWLPSHCRLSFSSSGLTTWIPQTFTVTSEHIRFYFLVFFLFYTF